MANSRYREVGVAGEACPCMTQYACWCARHMNTRNEAERVRNSDCTNFCSLGRIQGVGVWQLALAVTGQWEQVVEHVRCGPRD